MNVDLDKIIIPEFYDTWDAANDPEILHIVEKGGRGSAKSSHIAIIFILLMVKWPVNGVAARFIGDNNELSVYEQLKWAIEVLGLTPYFRVLKSPLRITYLPRGNYIAFRAGQYPARIKSLKDSRFPFSLLWLEELDEFKNAEEVRKITNSFLRGPLTEGQYKFFYSYNPPKRKHSWVNKEYENPMQPSNTFVHHSSYLTNPHLSKEFIREAEETKATKELRYRWEYMGEAIGTGAVPFTNLEIVDNCITDDMIQSFDNIRNGLDYGYGPDPLAFVRWHYDKKRRRIYAIDEIYGHKIGNRDLANRLAQKQYNYDIINSESAEPKSNAELRNDYNVPRLKAVRKGPGSVETGEKWLDELDAIIIDPQRTPNIAREFGMIDYATDKHGNPLPRLMDQDNHTIDATRYAFEDDMIQRGGMYVID